MTDKKYKYNSPQEWLIEYAGKLDAGKLFNEFTVLVQQMDADTIQDLYQSDMDADGYFTPVVETERLTSAAYPGEVFTVEQIDEEQYQSVYPFGFV